MLYQEIPLLVCALSMSMAGSVLKRTCHYSNGIISREATREHQRLAVWSTKLWFIIGWVGKRISVLILNKWAIKLLFYFLVSHWISEEERTTEHALVRMPPFSIHFLSFQRVSSRSVSRRFTQHDRRTRVQLFISPFIQVQALRQRISNSTVTLLQHRRPLRWRRQPSTMSTCRSKQTMWNHQAFFSCSTIAMINAKRIECEMFISMFVMQHWYESVWITPFSMKLFKKSIIHAARGRHEQLVPIESSVSSALV